MRVGCHTHTPRACQLRSRQAEKSTRSVEKLSEKGSANEGITTVRGGLLRHCLLWQRPSFSSQEKGQWSYLGKAKPNNDTSNNFFLPDEADCFLGCVGQASAPLAPHSPGRPAPLFNCPPTPEQCLTPRIRFPLLPKRTPAAPVLVGCSRSLCPSKSSSPADPRLKTQATSPGFYINFSQASLPDIEPASLRGCNKASCSQFKAPPPPARRRAAPLSPQRAPVPPPAPSPQLCRGCVPTDLRPQAVGGKEAAGCQRLD